MLIFKLGFESKKDIWNILELGNLRNSNKNNY